jgi:hypothetical protein
MSKGVKIDFGSSSGYTYNVYTSSSRTSWSDVPYISGFTGQYLTITGSSITGDVLYVKTTCPHCKDQIIKVKLVPDPITLTGSTVNGTCENCGDPGEPECNGAITLYVCGGVRPFTYDWSGVTKSNKVLLAHTKDLGNLEEGTYNVLVTDAYGLTATKTFVLDVAPCNPPTGFNAVAPSMPTSIPTTTPTTTPTATPTATPLPATYTPTPSPTPTQTSYNYYQYDVVRSGIPNAEGGYFNYIDVNGTTQTILQNSYGTVGRYCMRENSYQNNQYNLYTITYAGICGPGGLLDPTPTVTVIGPQYNGNIHLQPNYQCSEGQYGVSVGELYLWKISGGTAPYSVYLSGETETGWTLKQSGISENSDSNTFTGLHSSKNNNGSNPYLYAVKVVDANGDYRIDGTIAFGCPTYEPISVDVSYTCNGYAPTGATFTISNPSGGSGSGYYAVITSPENYDGGIHHTLPFTLSGLPNDPTGNYWYVVIYDGDGNGNGVSSNAFVNGLTCPDPPLATETLRIVFNTGASSTPPSAATFSGASSYSFTLSGPFVDMCSTTKFTSSNATTGLLQGSSHWVKNLTTGNVRKLYYNGNGNDYFTTQGSCTTN